MDLILTLLLVLGADDFWFVFSGKPTPLPALSFLDHSWMLDFAFKAKQGIWLGKDVAFTYGPLSQWLRSFPSILMGFSLGSFFKTSDLLPHWSVFLLSWGTAHMLLRGLRPWKRALYIIALLTFWCPYEPRISLALFFFVFSFDQASKIAATKSKLLLRACIVSLLLAASFLISADTGVYSVSGFLIVIGTSLFSARSDRDSIRRLGAFVLLCGSFFTLWALTVNTIVAKTFDFRFWIVSSEITKGYRWSLAAPMVREIRVRFLATVAIVVITFLLALIWSRTKSAVIVRRPSFLLAGLFFSLLTLQSGVVRSDWGHVAIGFFPAIALTGAILVGWDGAMPGIPGSDFPLLAALLLTAAFSGPTSMLMPELMKARMARHETAAACSEEAYFLDGACVIYSDFEKLDSVSSYLRKHTLAGDSIAVFPYENIYGDLARRRVSGAILQNYAAIGADLIHRQLASLEEDKPAISIYSADELATWPIDGVPNFTRSSAIWLYLQAHYRKEAEIQPGVLILRRADKRQQRWKMDSQLIPTNPAAIPVKLKTEIKIAGAMDPGADFLKFQITVKYPVWWEFAKPCSVRASLQFADGTGRSFALILPPNEPSSIWIYPWDSAQLMNYFSEDPSAWRKGKPRSALSSVSLQFTRMDWLSAIPSTVQVDRLEKVRLSLP